MIRLNRAHWTFVVLTWAYHYLQPHYELNYVDNGATKAIHVYFPGYQMIGHPENVWDLTNMVKNGFRVDGYSLVSKKTGKTDPALLLGLAIQSGNVFNFNFEGYELKKMPNGHWVFYRPDSKERIFSWRSAQRLGPWRNSK